ncbi:MAG TPA: 2-dehydropantoate 2-reductase N-terminal domain-containing protein, partial [Anaerolineales bacterium]|nr:2-dehydropantoate 2-reductase N-terminal domain-containing protein [Anaerolineales bacterium]
MHFLIYGTGAVGAYLGAKLSLAGQEVRFLARPGVARVLGSSGLRLIEDSRPVTVFDLSVSSSLAEIADGIDVVL